MKNNVIKDDEKIAAVQGFIIIYLPLVFLLKLTDTNSFEIPATILFCDSVNLIIFSIYSGITLY